MFLTLTTNEGEVIDRWEVEMDFGDIAYPMPANTMTLDIVNAYKRQKEKENLNNGDS